MEIRTDKTDLTTEWMILADHAEVIGGKVYLMGGGWETLTLNTLPANHAFGGAIAFHIPWNQCNKVHEFKIEILDPDGAALVSIEGQLEAGRPPGMSPGQSQRLPVAFNGQVEFKNLGPHSMKTFISDVQVGEVGFNVVAGPALLNEMRLASQRGNEH